MIIENNYSTDLFTFMGDLIERHSSSVHKTEFWVKDTIQIQTPPLRETSWHIGLALIAQ